MPLAVLRVDPPLRARAAVRMIQTAKQERDREFIVGWGISAAGVGVPTGGPRLNGRAGTWWNSYCQEQQDPPACEITPAGQEAEFVPDIVGCRSWLPDEDSNLEPTG